MNWFQNSKTSQAAGAVADLMLLNLCFLAGCLPVVTIGPAIVAMYTLLGRQLRGEGGAIVGPFFRAWRENLSTAWIFWIHSLLLAALALLLRQVVAGFETAPVFMAVAEWVLVVMLVFVYLAGGLLYPQIARFHNRPGAYVKNALVLALVKPLRTLINGLLFAWPVALALFAPGVFLRLGFVWPLLGFSLLFLVSAWLMRGILVPLEERSSVEYELSEQTDA